MSLFYCSKKKSRSLYCLIQKSNFLKMSANLKLIQTQDSWTKTYFVKLPCFKNISQHCQQSMIILWREQGGGRRREADPRRVKEDNERIRRRWQQIKVRPGLHIYADPDTGPHQALFGSGSWILVQFVSGSGPRVSILKRKKMLGRISCNFFLNLM